MRKKVINECKPRNGKSFLTLKKNDIVNVDFEHGDMSCCTFGKLQVWIKTVNLESI